MSVARIGVSGLAARRRRVGVALFLVALSALTYSASASALPPTPPLAETNSATEITESSGTLNATVNPNGNVVVVCTFEYGETESLGSSVPCSSPPGGGSSPMPVSALVSGLKANTTYDFRIMAENVAGVAFGRRESFKTSAALPTSKDQCKNDGWKNFGTTFKNQGQCVSFVETGKHAA